MIQVKAGDVQSCSHLASDESGIFLAILGRGPRALRIRKNSVVHRQNWENFQKIQFFLVQALNKQRYSFCFIDNND